MQYLRACLGVRGGTEGTAGGMQVTPCWGQWRVIAQRDLSLGGQAPAAVLSRGRSRGDPGERDPSKDRPWPMCSQS